MILGAFGGSWKFEDGPKTLKKNEYGHIFAPRGGLEVPKCRFGEGLEKRMKFQSTFGRKSEVSEGLNHCFFICFATFKQF